MRSPSIFRSRLGALIASQAVAGAFLVSSLHTVWLRIEGATASDSLNKKIAGDDLLGTAIAQDLAAFVLAIVALHVAVGLAGQVLAACTARAFPRDASRRYAWLAAGWTVVLFAWAHAANAVRFTWSIAGGGPSALARLEMGGVSVYDALSLLVAVAIGTVLVRAIRTTRAHAIAGARLYAYPAVVLAAVAAWRATGLAQADVQPVFERPHVILIGIDSLRPDVVGTGTATAVTPHIDRFLSEAVRFDDTITPLARTFPAWLTILTGRHPVATGARENLLPREVLTVPSTLGDVLRPLGYQAYYATDEVRSSNIDPAYGFDDVIGPRIGALDFLLGAVNDLPLSNLVANTWLGELLFPYTYVNRGAAVTYRPGTFVDEVESRVAFDRPTFLAVHLTLPHWPYHWAGDYEGSLAAALRQPYLYASSLIGVDDQFGQLLAMLERKGALGNAVVVVLSDHGEALGFAGDNLMHGREAREAARGVAVNIWGHGNSVLSPTQYSVLMAWRGYGAASLRGGSGRRSTPSSLEDLMPTVLDLLGASPALPFDGVSLAPVLHGGADAEQSLGERVRYTESGITIGFTKLGEAKVDDIVERGLLAYAINPRNGRLELKREYLVELMRSKERAAIGSDRVLAAVPMRDGSTGFLVVPRTGGVPRFLEQAPDPVEDPELRRMWDGLASRYHGELHFAPRS